MGVTGLWRLVEPSGKPVPLETLENKVLAIDVSIWLHQAIKGFQDSQGAAVPNAHLLGIYHRVCKLLYFRIKPVFIFDGGVPHLKRETIIKRQQQRSKKVSEAERIKQQLLSTLLKHTAIKNVLSEKTKASLTSPKTSPTKAKDGDDNLYKLPPTDFIYNSSDEEESSASDYSPTKTWDLQTIDEQSPHFKSLPADVRHDILTDLKETRKQSSWGRIHEMPKNSGDFSGFQMKRLLKRFSVQTSLDEAAKEMGGRSLSLAELESLLNDQGVVATSGKRIASDENARYLLIKDLKKAMDEAKLQESKETPIINDSEYQKRLEAALELSLQDVPGTSKSEPQSTFLENFCDGDFISSSDNSDNEERILDKNMVSAKNYMMEYSGLTPSEIEKIMGKNKVVKTKASSVTSQILKKLDGNKDTHLTSSKPSATTSESSDDDEFLEVSEYPELSIEEKKEPLEIVIGTSESTQQEDDLFNDIFSSTNKTPVLFENAINIPANISVLNDGHNTSPAKMINDTKCSEDVFTENKISDLPTAVPSMVTNLELSSDIPPLKSSHLEMNELSSKKEGTCLQTKKPCSTVETVNLQENMGTTDNDISLNKEEDLIPQLSSKNNDNSITTKSYETTDEKFLTTEQLQDMSNNLRNEKMELEAGRLTNERLANNLTDQIYQEAQELLQLFGVPYIIAPMEAEAQCAFLNSINLTDGTITDDSDVWLFGGKTVYKNFFNQRKHVLEYRLERIQQDFKLTREQMVLLALLVGSDYTTGLQGVGPVTALEIIAKFPPTDGLSSGLSRFRKWLTTDKTRHNLTLRNKLKNVIFTEGFPSLQVIEAYLEPTVDSSEEAFTWARPDIDGLKEFARQKFGWNHIKSDEILKPVVKRLNEKITQHTIKDYFQTKQQIYGSDVEAKMSKRVKKAVETIGKGGENIEEEPTPKPKKKKKTPIDKDIKVLQATMVKSRKRVPDIKKNTQDQIKKPKPAPDLHKKEIIPQKEQDKVNAVRSRLKAIEILRKSKNGPGYVKKRKPMVRKQKADAELSESSSD